ncbi:dTDP-4-dehydrorhamnose 3,5-epimerase family protein [Candidatus Dojkabacteria bacterium]|nr:dTDP-4-dehydrorhamnose 3,5-epimerase family protein [Candidatus Dojkabacteria bacterium]
MAEDKDLGPKIKTPLRENLAVPSETLREIYDAVETGQNPNAPEELFYNDIEIDRSKILPQQDFNEEHTTNPEHLAQRIQGVLVRTGAFIDIKKLEAAREEAAAQGAQGGHFRDERGDLTLLKQEPHDRLAQVIDENTIPTSLSDLFDAENSPVTSSYTSRTKIHQGRDIGYSKGKAGIHIHTAQTDRFVFTEGAWEIVLVDMRQVSPSYGTRVCLSFDASQENQLALVIPPGIAHTIACFREAPDGKEYATLVNFPTLGYSELPPSIAKGNYSPQTAIRAMEGRLDPTRVIANSGNKTEAGTTFNWLLYQRWLLNRAKLEERKEEENTRNIVLAGGSNGLLGSLIEQELWKNGFVTESASRYQALDADGINMRIDLTKLSEDQIVEWLLGSNAQAVILTAAWTDVPASIALASFINKYQEELTIAGIHGTDPVSEININFVVRLANAIKKAREIYGRQIKLVLPQTTMASIGTILNANYYARTKAVGIQQAQQILGNNALVATFGYPYVIDAAQIPQSAKSMTLHKRIEQVVRAIRQEGSSAVSAFFNDAIDLTDMNPVLANILQYITNPKQEPNPLDQRLNWVSTLELCNLIADVYVSLYGGDIDEVKKLSITSASMSGYKPTNGDLLRYNNATGECSNPVYAWITNAVRVIKQKLRIDIDLLQFIKEEANYSKAYPSFSSFNQDPTTASTYRIKLINDIIRIMVQKYGAATVSQDKQD